MLRDIARFRRAALLAAEVVNRGGGYGGGEDGEAAVKRVVKCYGFMWTFRYSPLFRREKLPFILLALGYWSTLGLRLLDGAGMDGTSASDNV